MAIGLADNIRVGQQKPLDDKYYNDLQPYVSVTEVNTLIPITQRYVGLKVNINGVEYWYKNGIANGSLVPFLPEIPDIEELGGWSLGGNEITEDNFLGSTNDVDIVIKRNDQEKIRVSEEKIIIGEPKDIQDYNFLGDESFFTYANDTMGGYDTNPLPFINIQLLERLSDNITKFTFLRNETNGNNGDDNFFDYIEVFYDDNTSYFYGGPSGTGVTPGDVITYSGISFQLDSQYRCDILATYEIATSNDVLLEINSDSKGVVFPRLTTDQRNDIVSPRRGVLVFNVDSNYYEYYDGTTWKILQNESAWTLLGNEISNGQFIGSTNDEDIIFKRNNTNVGKLGDNNSVIFGQLAGSNSINNSQSVIIGQDAGVDSENNTVSVMVGRSAGLGAIGNYDSVFIGKFAGYVTNGAYESVFIGENTGWLANNAYQSVGIGRNAGVSAEGSFRTIFLGIEAGREAVNATRSFFFGQEAGRRASDAYETVAIGWTAGRDANNSYRSTFIGTGAGQSAPNANNSIFLGAASGRLASSTIQSFFVGYESGDESNNGQNLIFIGHQTGQFSPNGNSNIFIGTRSGIGVPSVNNNIFIGQKTGQGFTSNIVGNNNIIIGTNISLPNETNNSFNIGGVLFGVGSFSNSSQTNPSIIPVANPQVGIGIVTPHTSSILDLTSTNKGLLIPRMTTTQRNAISNPALGLIVFDVTEGSVVYYNGTSWQLINPFINTPDGIRYNSSIGINTTPTASLGGFPTLTIDGAVTLKQGRAYRLEDTGGTSRAFAVMSPDNIVQVGPQGASIAMSLHGGSGVPTAIVTPTAMGVGTTAPHASSILDLLSTDKGVLIPRMTLSQRNALAAPANGLLIHNTTDSDFDFYSTVGNSWRSLVSMEAAQVGAVPFITQNGAIGQDSTNFFWDNTNKRLGIGAPTSGAGAQLSLISAGNPSFWLLNTNINHPFTGISFNPPINSNVVASWVGGAASQGGMQLNGFNTAAATNNPVLLRGYIGSTSPTVAAVGIIGQKSNGGTGATNLVGNERILDIRTSVTVLYTFTSESFALGTIAPHASALIDMTSTSKGLLIPRMTTIERDAITNPATGLQVYNTTTNSLDFYNSTKWVNTGVNGQLNLASTISDISTTSWTSVLVTPVLPIGQYLVNYTVLFTKPNSPNAVVRAALEINSSIQFVHQNVILTSSSSSCTQTAIVEITSPASVTLLARTSNTTTDILASAFGAPTFIQYRKLE